MITSEYILELSNVFHSGQGKTKIKKLSLFTKNYIAFCLHFNTTYILDFSWGRHICAKSYRGHQDRRYLTRCQPWSPWRRTFGRFGLKRQWQAGLARGHIEACPGPDPRSNSLEWRANVHAPVPGELWLCDTKMRPHSRFNRPSNASLRGSIDHR